MKSSIIKIFLTSAAVIGLASGASAQNTYSGYFLEDYSVRYQMNPAFGGTSKGYVGFPVLSNLNIAMRGTLHVSDLLYPNPVPGGKKTVLFTNPEISVSKAMGKFSNNNQIGANIKLDIVNVGFSAFGGYNAVGINVVSGVNAKVPKAFFSLLKEGVSNQSYDISNMRLGANAYAELALNHSRDLSQVLPGLRVGAAVKFLFGVANVDAYLDDARLTLGENEWTASTNAKVYASCKGLSYKTEYSDDTHKDYVSGIDMGTPGLNGFGLGFDLGGVYEWNDFKFSLALLDLGFISYGNTMYAATDGTVFNTDEYSFSINDDSEDKVWDQMIDKVALLYQLDDHGNIGSRTRSLKTTLNIGAEYEFPYYRPLHFGFLSSTYFNGPFTWSQVRLSANVKPCKVFSASANLALGTYGVGFGWLLNLNTKKGLNFFIGMDRTLGKLAKQGIPLNSNAEVNLGINFPF